MNITQSKPAYLYIKKRQSAFRSLSCLGLSCPAQVDNILRQCLEWRTLVYLQELFHSHVSEDLSELLSRPWSQGTASHTQNGNITFFLLLTTIDEGTSVVSDLASPSLRVLFGICLVFRRSVRV